MTMKQGSVPYLLLTLSLLTSIFSWKSAAADTSPIEKDIPSLIPSNHTRNVAILLSSSTFYHNYRHTTNTLAIYHALKLHGGFTDDNIILMLADEVACNARNPFKNTIFPNGSAKKENNNEETDGTGRGRGSKEVDDNGRRWPLNLYDNVQVDYSGDDVTVDNFFRVLLGRHPKHTPSYQRLDLDDPDTNVFIYITGHGGDGFFKFRDVEDFTTTDLRGVLEQMQVMKRFKNVLFLTDTCQAFTLAPDDDDIGNGSNIDLKNVYTIASSLKGENSYAHHGDMSVGHSVIDRYMYFLMENMGGFSTIHANVADPYHNHDSEKGKWGDLHEMSVKFAMVDSMYTSNRRSKLGANIGWSDALCERRMDQVPLSDFFVMRQGEDTDTSGMRASRESLLGDVQLLHGQVDFW